jgi:hypothetical protein
MIHEDLHRYSLHGPAGVAYFLGVLYAFVATPTVEASMFLSKGLANKF